MSRAKLIRFRITWDCNSKPFNGRLPVIGHELWRICVTVFRRVSYSFWGISSIGLAMLVASTFNFVDYENRIDFVHLHKQISGTLSTALIERVL